MPNTTSTSQVAHMMTMTINTPNIPSIHYLSSSGFKVHNPNLVDSNSLIYYLYNTYMNKFSISYINRKSFWSVPEMTLLPEKELIDTLSIHSYNTNWIQEDMYNIHTMDYVKLIEFQELNLKSLDDYLKAANFLFQFKIIFKQI